MTDADDAGQSGAETAGMNEEYARLQRDSHLLKTLMDVSTDHIYFKDARSRFVMINRAMADLFQLDSPDEAVGKSDADFFSSEHAQQALHDEQRIIKTGLPLVNIEEKETWPTGGTTWVSSSKLPVRDNAGAVIGTCGISRDITRRKRAQEERERLIGELQKAADHIHMLHGLIPICANCKRVRDDKGYWQQVETYISGHSEATFSHGLCEECSKKLLAEQAGGKRPSDDKAGSQPGSSR